MERQSVKPTVGFRDRYENDPEFKQQVDEGRKRRDGERSLARLEESLRATRGDFGKKGKLY